MKWYRKVRVAELAVGGICGNISFSCRNNQGSIKALQNTMLSQYANYLEKWASDIRQIALGRFMNQNY